uniref:Cellular repressor of E1A-stimulated genes 2 n=2 Tax=Lepisosteus oculatus TaxID=7918 RepID=W5M055_LEPOC
KSTMTETRRLFDGRRDLILVILVALFCLGETYVILNSVSWAITSEVDEELEISSSEDAAPALLEDTGSIWKQQSYPASIYKDHLDRRRGQRTADAKQVSSPSRMFSYRREGLNAAVAPPPPPHERTARTARYLAHYSDWGFLATLCTQEKIQGRPFGSVFSVSDGPLGNSTGTPYFCVSALHSSVEDLKVNPVASLTFPAPEGDYCREHLMDPEEPRCAQLTLTGRMLAVEEPEGELAREAMFSRHPVMKKWPRGQDWFFMKMHIEQVWLQNLVGRVSFIPLDDYFKASPDKP